VPGGRWSSARRLSAGSVQDTATQNWGRDASGVRRPRGVAARPRRPGRRQHDRHQMIFYSKIEFVNRNRMNE
jgi:hypothetical protein